MHYKDGTEAKVGDWVKFGRYSYKASTQKTDVGVLINATPGSSACNGMVMMFDVNTMPTEFQGVGAVSLAGATSVTIGDCELLHRPETPKS